MQKPIISLLLLLLAVNSSMAGGYQVSLHGQKQTGMGLIGTSLHMDASAAFFNPGGLAMMPHDFSVTGGINGIFSDITYQMEQPSLYQASTENPPGTPFHFYGAAKLTDKLAAGVAVNTPFGNNLTWEDDWAGRFLIQNISLQAITIQPTLSYRLSEYLSVGAGFVYALGTVDLEQALPLDGPDGEGRINIEGNTANYGFNAGIQFTHPSGLAAGVSYRSEIEMDVDDGQATFVVPPSLTAGFPSPTNVSMQLPLPANLDAGVSYQATPELMIGMNLNYVFWDTYEELVFDFEDNTDMLQDSENPREYSNTLIIRLGGEYKINELFTARAGTYFDPSPVHEDYFTPETPSLDNLAFTGGLSFAPDSRLSVDASLLFIMGLEDEGVYKPENFGGTYKSRILIPGLGISYQL